MIIGIDGNEANTKSRVGIGQFSYNVIFYLEKSDKKNHYFIYLKEKPLADFPKEREGWKYIIFGPSKLWTHFALPIKLFTQKQKLDVFYSPSHYSPRFCPFPTVISIMDLWHHRHPEQFAKKDLYQLIEWEKYSVKRARHIITISEFSKREIIDIYHVPESKVTVAYPGFTNVRCQMENVKTREIKSKFGVKGDYLIYIGTLQPKKNIEGLIKALKILISHYPDISLVIVGKKGWLYEKIFDLVKELKLEGKVIFTGFVDEDEKAVLLSGAKAFVFPSLYEGFGIPVLEAMDLSVPVVTSNAGSLPEVGGKVALYCDPLKPENIAECLEKVLSLNKSARDEIIEAGKKQAQKFSWERCAKTVLGVLESVKEAK